MREKKYFYRKLILAVYLVIVLLAACRPSPRQITPRRGTLTLSPQVESLPATPQPDDLETLPPTFTAAPSKIPSKAKVTLINQTPGRFVNPEIEAIIADLADRLNVSTAEIKLLEVVPDEFPAGDLGCPQPGTTPRPIPAIVTGRRVVLEYEGGTYTYHVHGQQAVFCGES